MFCSPTICIFAPKKNMMACTRKRRVHQVMPSAAFTWPFLFNSITTGYRTYVTTSSGTTKIAPMRILRNLSIRSCPSLSNTV